MPSVTTLEKTDRCNHEADTAVFKENTMASWEIRHVNHLSSDHEKKEVSKYWEGLYTWMTASRLEKPWDGETYGFAAAFIDDTCVGTTSYTISRRGLGIVSQVHTDADHRGKGICGATFNAAVDAFEAHGTKAAYLAAWAQWIRDIYMKRGFVNVGNMGQRGAFKLTITDAGKDENLFRKGQRTELRPLGLGDQADITSLFCAVQDRVVKSYELGCYGGSYFEGEFYVLQNQKVEGIIPEERKDKEGYRAVVLDGEETILGLGTVIPSSRRHEGHTGVLDFFLHPAYFDQAAGMIDRLTEGCELDHLAAYIEKNEDDKRELLRQAGFTKAADLSRQLVIADEAFDLEMWRK